MKMKLVVNEAEFIVNEKIVAVCCFVKERFFWSEISVLYIAQCAGKLI